MKIIRILSDSDSQHCSPGINFDSQGVVENRNKKIRDAPPDIQSCYIWYLAGRIPDLLDIWPDIRLNIIDVPDSGLMFVSSRFWKICPEAKDFF